MSNSYFSSVLPHDFHCFKIKQYMYLSCKDVLFQRKIDIYCTCLDTEPIYFKSLFFSLAILRLNYGLGLFADQLIMLSIFERNRHCTRLASCFFRLFAVNRQNKWDFSSRSGGHAAQSSTVSGGRLQGGRPSV